MLQDFSKDLLVGQLDYILVFAMLHDMRFNVSIALLHPLGKILCSSFFFDLFSLFFYNGGILFTSRLFFPFSFSFFHQSVDCSIYTLV